jgi:hypothetical protein
MSSPASSAPVENDSLAPHRILTFDSSSPRPTRPDCGHEQRPLDFGQTHGFPQPTFATRTNRHTGLVRRRLRHLQRQHGLHARPQQRTALRQRSRSQRQPREGLVELAQRTRTLYNGLSLFEDALGLSAYFCRSISLDSGRGDRPRKPSRAARLNAPVSGSCKLGGQGGKLTLLA